MSKPSTARPSKSVPQQPQSTKKPPKPPGLQKLEARKYDGAPAVRVRAIRLGHNEYSVVEETFAERPTSTKVLAAKVDGSSAMYRCRLRAEELLGPNRLGGTGLE